MGKAAQCALGLMERAVYILFRSVDAVLRLLPLRVCFGLGLVLGRLAHAILWSYRTLARRNVRMAFGGGYSDREVHRIVRRHFALLGANLFAGSKMAVLPPESILRAVRVTGAERLEPLHQAGRGIVGLIGHQSCWEVIAQCFQSTWPGEGGAVYQPLGNRWIGEHVNRQRQRRGLHLFERRRGLVAAAQFLGRGGAVGVLCDQFAGEQGLWAPFFGRLASTTPLPDLLARRTGCVLVPYRLQTVGFAKWHLTIEPWFEVEDSPVATTARINREIEAHVRASPADWFWVHNRWKTPRSHFLLGNTKRGVHVPDGETIAPFRMALRSPNWLGDACMSLPAVRAFARGRPDARISVVCRPNLAAFWRRCHDVDEVVVLPRSRSVVAAAKILRRAGPFEVGILFPNSLRSALEFRLAGMTYLVGERGDPLRSRLLTKIMPPLGRKAGPQHQAALYLRIAERCGAVVGSLERSGGSFLHCEPVVGTPDMYAVLCPGAVYGPAKRWLPDRFAEVARTVAERHGLHWIVTGTAAERELCESVCVAMGDCARNAAGETPLEVLLDLVAGARFVLTNDTGTMHLAAAAGTRVVAIFGSTEPVLTGPLGAGHEVLRHQVECSPCFLRTCPLDFRCMQAVGVGEVLDAVERALSMSKHSACV